MSELVDTLDAILTHWEGVYPGKLSGLLQAGATESELADVQARLAFDFPPELREFYKWSKGPPDWHGVNIVAGPMPFLWLSLDASSATVARDLANEGLWQPNEGGRMWPLFDLDRRCVSVKTDPEDESGSIWYNDIPGVFSRISGSLTQYLATVLDDYPEPANYPSWDELEAAGFAFDGKGRYGYGEKVWLDQVGYGPR